MVTSVQLFHLSKEENSGARCGIWYNSVNLYFHYHIKREFYNCLL